MLLLLSLHLLLLLFRLLLSTAAFVTVSATGTSFFYTQNSTYLQAILTTGHLLEVDDVLVRLQCVARRQVGVDVALLEPRVVVAGETGWNLLAVVHTLVQRLELSIQLTASLDIRPIVLGQCLLLLLCHTKLLGY